MQGAGIGCSLLGGTAAATLDDLMQRAVHVPGHAPGIAAYIEMGAVLKPVAQGIHGNCMHAAPREREHVRFEPFRADRIPCFPGVARQAYAMVHEDDHAARGHRSFRSAKRTSQR